MVLEKFFKDFLLIWLTIEPISSLAIFISITSQMSKKERNSVALRACVYSACILFGAIVVGQLLLTAMGIRLVSFQLAGGVILFLFGIQMIFGKTSVWISEQPEAGHDVAVFPLAIPSIVGPEAIMAVILLTDNHQYSLPMQVITTLAMIIILSITYLLLLLGNSILKRIGKNGSAILERLMGILLTAFATELIVVAISSDQWALPPR